MDYKEYLKNIKWEDPYALTARKWMEGFEQQLDAYSLFLIHQEFPTQKSLQIFLQNNQGNTQQAFLERIKHLKLKPKRLY